MTAQEFCYYCGKYLTPPTKRRMERGIYYKFHAACATKWDNEGRRG